MDPETLLRHAGFVRAIARGLLGPDQADDVVQETMLAAWQHPPRDPSRLRSWLGAIGRRLSLTKLRSNRRRNARERGAARLEALPSTLEVAGQLEVQRRVVEAVVALEEPYRSTVVHRFFHDRSVEEIARTLGIPQKTVESRLTRALAQLRARLDRDGGRHAWSSALLPLAWTRPAAGGGIAGGLIMSTKTKVALAVAILAVAGVGVFGAARLSRGEDVPSARADSRRAHEQVSAATPVTPDARDAKGSESANPDVAAVAAAEVLPPLPPAPPSGIIGRITCADGKPAAGARVTAFGNLAQGDGATEPKNASFETHTDKHGIYRFEDLPAGSYQLRAFHDGHAPSPRWGAAYGVPSPNGVEVSLQLKLGATVKVLVRDAAGAPVEGAEVLYLTAPNPGPAGGQVALATTDVRGEAVAEHLPDGTNGLLVRALGEEAIRALLGRVRDGATVLVEVRIGAFVSGRVTLEDGTPVAGATLFCVGPEGAPALGTESKVKIDAGGHFTIRGLASGRYQASVRGDGLATHWNLTIDVGEAPETTVTLILGRPLVAGRILGWTPGGGRVTVALVLDSKVSRQPLETAVSADGGFGFNCLMPGAYKLVARMSGAELEAERALVVNDGDRHGGIELTLRAPSQGTVELELVDGGGAFLGSVSFQVEDGLGLASPARAARIAPQPTGLGRYRFPVGAGNRKITVEWANGTKQTVVEMAVEGGGTVYKTVLLK